LGPLLQIRNLSVEVAGERLLEDINFDVERGQTNVIFGPNGSGKTSLINAIMGIPGYEVVGGTIIFDGKDITSLSLDEKVRLGIGVAFQNPPEIRGLKLRDMLKMCARKGLKEDLSEEELELAKRFNLTSMLDRDVNFNFSGGEKKRSEILQVLLMKPKLLILDEPDSGVDFESIVLIGSEIQSYLSRTGSSAIIVTHQGHILDHVEAHRGAVLMRGTIYCYGKPLEVLDSIKRKGYGGCEVCRRRRTRMQE